MILVVGATGRLGNTITRRLLANGQHVRILARASPDYQSLADAGAQPVPGDLKSRVSLDAACKGVAVIITTANSALRGNDDNVQTVDLKGNRNLIDAARAANVKQFIFTSALGVDVNSPVPFLRAKAESEYYLRASGLPYTILAPNIFMDVWVPMVVGGPAASGLPVTLVGEGRRRHSFIAVADVASFATAAVGHPAAINRQLPIGGPEALSWRDVVAVFERVLGRKIEIRNCAPGEPLPGLPEMIGQMMAAMDTYDSPVEMAEMSRTFGVTQTSLEEFVRREFAGVAPP